MKYKCISLVAFGGLFLSSALLVGARTWTDVKGRKLEAEIVSKIEDSVTIHLKGKDTEISLKKLSKADRDFVAEWEAEEADEEPKTETKKALPESAEVYFKKAWPKLVSVDTDIEIEEEVTDEGSYIYRSPHYEFVSNAKLSKVPVKRFAVLFEATRQYVQSVPYASLKAHKEDVRYKVMLFSTHGAYVRAGAPEGSAGVYLPSKDLILVKFESLGLIKRGSSWALDYDRTNKTLPHEITHQLTDREYYSEGSRGWFTEGFAEYVAATPYRSGKFGVNKAPGAVEQYVTHFSKKDGRGRNLGEEIDVVDLKEFMMMSYREFAYDGDANYNYGVGALLVTYFNHYDGEGDAANIKNFLRALKQGKKGEDALKSLLAGRTFDELEQDITKGWRKRGVKLNFD